MTSIRPNISPPPPARQRSIPMKHAGVANSFSRSKSGEKGIYLSTQALNTSLTVKQQARHAKSSVGLTNLTSLPEHLGKSILLTGTGKQCCNFSGPTANSILVCHEPIDHRSLHDNLVGHVSLQLLVWQADAVLDANFVAHAALLAQDGHTLNLDTILDDASAVAGNGCRRALDACPSADFARPTNDGVKNACIMLDLSVLQNDGLFDSSSWANHGSWPD